MLNTLKMAGLAAVMTIGGLTGVSAPASAQTSLEIIIGPNGARMRARDYCQDNPWYEGCRDWRRRYGDDRYGDDRYGDDRYGDDRYGSDSWNGQPREYRRVVRYCSNEAALDKARRMGLRRARIVSAGQRSLQVAGRDSGRTVIVRFSRRSGCPII